MYKTQVLAYFEARGTKQKGIAKLLDISQPAISKWPDLVPELQAMKLSKLTNDELSYDASLYSKEQAA